MTENLTSDILNMSIPLTSQESPSVIITSQVNQEVPGTSSPGGPRSVCLIHQSDRGGRWQAERHRHPPPPPSRRSPHPLNHQPSLILTAGLLRDYSGTSSFSSLGIQMITICISLSSQHNMTGLDLQIYFLLFPNNANY